MVIFSRSEMERRATNLRSKMEEQGIDCVIATSYASSYYLSGAPIHPYGRPMATLIPLKGQPAMVTSFFEKAHTEKQSWINDLRTYYDFNVELDYENPQPPLASLVRLVRSALADRHLEGARLGIEKAHLPVERYELLTNALPNAQFVDVSDTLQCLRLVLSEEELRLVRLADSIADLGGERLIDELAPGRSAYELTRRVKSAMEEEFMQRHPEIPFFVHVNLGLGPASKGAGHAYWTSWGLEDRVSPGQVVEFEMSVWVWGYMGNVERAVAVGGLTDQARTAFEAMVEAHGAGIEAVRPGAKLADIDHATKNALARHGHTSVTGTGLGRGIACYQANAREIKMDIRLYSDVTVEPGMAMSIEPRVDAPGVGVLRHCTTVIVTEDGHLVDSRLPTGIISV